MVKTRNQDNLLELGTWVGYGLGKWEITIIHIIVNIFVNLLVFLDTTIHFVLLVYLNIYLLFQWEIVMAALEDDFESWLSFKLKELNTDENVFGSYIKGILDGEETLEEKTEALEEILTEITVSLFLRLCYRIKVLLTVIGPRLVCW